MLRKVRILLTGGGSGGHIIPNLAVASAIKDRKKDAELFYIASRSKLDSDLLKTSGIEFKPIFSGKLRRYFSWQNFIDPLFVLIGFFQSLGILLKFKPQLVFSKGGFVSLPVVFAARFLRIKIILHESDSRMGIANKISARIANKVCVAFPGMDRSFIFTGNPIRSEIIGGTATAGYKFTGFDDSLPVILIWGGSQGAKQINDLLSASFDKFTKEFQIIHVTGAGKSIGRHHKNYAPFDYLGEELRDIYAITDMIIGRAGANSIYEVAILGKPNIIIPLANADQQKNAGYFEEMGAALVYKANQNLFDISRDLWQNKALKKEMIKSLNSIAKPDAAKKIADLIINEITKKRTS